MVLTLKDLNLVFLSYVTFVAATQELARELQNGPGIHLPIYHKRGASRLQRRDGATATLGLGDYRDVTYSVLVTVGGISTPLVLDTGSADLWVISDDCTDCLRNAPFYPHTTFKSTGLGVNLLYGDSRTGTHASGLIGKDKVELAGVGLEDQFFAAIDDTNTTVEDTGAAGIFGLGFPYSSVVWTEIFKQEHSTGTTLRRDDTFSQSGEGFDARRFDFPEISSMFTPTSAASTSGPNRRQASGTPSQTQSFLNDVFSSYTRTAPLLTRLVATNNLLKPQLTVTLQRDAIDVGGNVGTLSVGALPSGVKEDNITWVPVRKYSFGQGGLPSPPGTQESYPITWEVVIDDVYFDGVKLPKSNLTTSITPSALIDTGNSLIRGPSDVVTYIHALLASTSSNRPPEAAGLNTVISCSEPHNLTFQIGGQLFPVDPRDFITQAYQDTVDWCVPNLAVTDPPREGSYLYSWSLGSPFLKGVLTTFHYGNLTMPSQDPPKIGFLSTVPRRAVEFLQDAVKDAEKNGGNFPAQSEPAPTGTKTGAVRTNAQGVPIVKPTHSSAVKSAMAVGGVHLPMLLLLWLVHIYIL